MKHNTTRAIAVTTLAAAALAATAGTAAADTHPTPADAVTVEILPGVQFTVSPSAGQGTYTTGLGSIAVENGTIRLEDAQGRPVDTPFTAPAQNATAPEPIAGIVERPVADPISPTAVGAPIPADPLADANAAWKAAGPYSGLAGAIGGMVGGVGGAAIGCPAGVLTGGTLMSIVSLSTLTIPGIISGCIVGAGLVGALGAGAGLLVTSVPVGVAVATQKYNEMQAQRAAGIVPTAPAPPNS